MGKKSYMHTLNPDIPHKKADIFATHNVLYKMEWNRVWDFCAKQ